MVRLHEQNYAKDVIYLFQFKGTRTASSVSPYCMKVEAYLRLHGLKYEKRYTSVGRGKNGKLPFIELNGEQIADSQMILKRLAERYRLHDYESTMDAAVGHAISRMVDTHTVGLLNYFASLNFGPKMKAMTEGMLLQPLLVPIGAKMMEFKLRSKTYATVGVFTDDQYLELLENDLRQIQTLLGDKKYLFGDRPSPADCTLFGHLGSEFFPVPGWDTKTTRVLNSPHFAPLKNWLNRFREHVFGGEFHT